MKKKVEFEPKWKSHLSMTKIFFLIQLLSLSYLKKFCIYSVGQSFPLSLSLFLFPSLSKANPRWESHVDFPKHKQDQASPWRIELYCQEKYARSFQKKVLTMKMAFDIIDFLNAWEFWSFDKNIFFYEWKD